MAHERDDKAARRFHALYEAAVGPIASVLHLPAEHQRASSPHIDVFVFRMQQMPFHLLLTGGMSSREQPGPTHRPRIELYARLAAVTDQETDRARVQQLCRALWRIAQHPFVSEPARALAEWHFWRGRSPLVPGSDLSGFLLTMPPTSEAKLQATLGPKLGAQLLHAFAISEGEALAAERAGRAGMPTFARALLRDAGPYSEPARSEVPSVQQLAESARGTLH